MTLFETRKKFELSQMSAAKIAKVPLRTYLRYEADNDYGSGLKRKAIIDLIVGECEITEDKGILSIEQIMKGVRNVITKHYQETVSLCYLYGSYAKGYATERSDVDLCVQTSLQGLDYVGLAEDIHLELHKKIDIVRLDNASSNLIFEIMKDGIKIYG